MSSGGSPLSIELGGGLVLRTATPADVEALAEFNMEVHSDDPEEPETPLAEWTRDLLSGDHPTTGLDDYTVVVDESAAGRIVSCMCLISQQWSYEDVPFGCGRMELVATDPDYRRKGLIRRQFELLHSRSAAKGELVQVITGIPWYYRQFGYEMALDLGGARAYSWDRPGNLVEVEEETYRSRPATEADIAALAELYLIHCRSSMVWRVRSEAEWRYQMLSARESSPYKLDVRVIETADGDAVAYVEVRAFGQRLYVREAAVRDGHPWRPVLAFLARALRAEADELNAAADRKKEISHIEYGLGVEHPVYKALSAQLERLSPPYAWYVRVPDLRGFLRHVSPVLERRLAGSVMAGYSGTLRISFYTDSLTLVFEGGRLKEVGDFEPRRVGDGDGVFPDLTFLQLLFGHRSTEELRLARPDCYSKDIESKLLLDLLFPRRHSHPIGLG